MRVLAASLALLVLAACSPKPPAGFDAAKVDAALGKAIGSPSTCVLLARKGESRAFHRYGSNMTCGRVLPSCAGDQARVSDLLKAAAIGAAPVMRSCDSTADGTRTVGWAAGVSPSNPDIVYAAFIEVENARALPGRVMADRLAGALARNGL